MKISIFGLGYVGVVCSACLAKQGHTIIGVDPNELKVQPLNRGRSPIVEPSVNELLVEAHREGRLTATADSAAAVLGSDLSMICVGTPSKRSGGLDLRYVEAVCRDIGKALKHKAGRHTIAVRSTVLPGSTRELIVPVLESQSEKKAGVGFGLVANPEFLRESSAVVDYFSPSLTIIGEFDKSSGDFVESVYRSLPGKIIRTSVETAELIKYGNNAWHAAKVAFANEIGVIAKAAGVDGREVMRVVCEDARLNLSSYYMRPGFAFGGSCLPKDLRALIYRATQLDVAVPLLESIVHSNRLQAQRGLELVVGFGKRRVGMLGLSFKPGTDDLRESPFVELAEALIGKGYQLRVFDRNVDYARVHGANREYIEAHIPHVSALLGSNLEDVIQKSDVIVVCHRDPEFIAALQAQEAKCIVDLVGLSDGGADVQGICW